MDCPRRVGPHGAVGCDADTEGLESLYTEGPRVLLAEEDGAGRLPEVQLLREHARHERHQGPGP